MDILLATTRIILNLFAVIGAVNSFIGIVQYFTVPGKKGPNKIIISLTVGMILVSIILDFNTSTTTIKPPLSTPGVTDNPSTIQIISNTPTSAPTSPLKEWTVNRQLKCINYCDPGSDPRDNFVDHISVQITVISFTFDTAQKQMSMHLLFDSQSNNTNCSFGDGFSFRDETTGTMYAPSGAFKDGGSFSLVKNQQQKSTALYSFIPSSGSAYTLRPGTIFCEGHSIGFTPTYGDLPFEFP